MDTTLNCPSVNTLLLCGTLVFLTGCTNPAISQSILFVGDTNFYDQWNVTAELLNREGYGYPLLNYRSILSNADLVVANLEAPITDQTQADLRGTKEYILKQSIEIVPKTLRELNISIVSLGNNHAFDYGTEGLKKTQQQLQKYNIRHFGAGMTEKEASVPVLLDRTVGHQQMKFAILGGMWFYKKYQSRFGYYAEQNKPGVHLLDIEKVSEQIRTLKNREPERYVVVFPHWGYNYQWRTSSQRKIAEHLIDAGADLIIGHGAHHLQEIEQIDGHWVVYDVGNFMFNSFGKYSLNPDVPPFSLIARLIIQEKTQSSPPELSLRLYPIQSDTNQTHFQGNFVTQQEFKSIVTQLTQHNRQEDLFSKHIRTGEDEYGYYLALSVR
ncbi:MAG: CapA family protein [Candidatus Peregrinibacteria bacterium]